MTATEQIETGVYEGEIRFRGAAREISARGIMDSCGFSGTAEGRTVIIDIDLSRQGKYLAGFAQVTTPVASMPVAVTARIDRDTITITGPEFEGLLKRTI